MTIEVCNYGQIRVNVPSRYFEKVGETAMDVESALKVAVA